MDKVILQLFFDNDAEWNIHVRIDECSCHVGQQVFELQYDVVDGFVVLPIEYYPQNTFLPPVLLV